MFPENLNGLPLFITKNGLWNDAVSVYDVINVMQVCIDVNVITFVFTYFFRACKQNNSDKMCVSSILMCM